MMSAMVLFGLVVLDAVMWTRIIGEWSRTARVGIYFLPVAQGEAALIVLPRGVMIMVDAGPPNGTAVAALQKILPQGDKRIDLAVISYPQEDDWGGYSAILDHYSVGAFVYNGRSNITDPADWSSLVAKITAKHIPLITVGAGDRIASGGNVSAPAAAIDVLSPDPVFAQSAEPRDTAIVARIAAPGFTALFPADIGANVAGRLLADRIDLRANILKAPFPLFVVSSGTSPGKTALGFLRAAAPDVIALSPGVKGTPSALSPIAPAWFASSTGARAVGADTAASGAVGIFPENGRLLLYNEE